MQRVGAQTRRGHGARPICRCARFFFDCMYLNGQVLVERSNAERWQALASAVPASELVPRVDVSRPEEAERVLQAALSSGHEGVVVKSLASLYEAGRRGAGWVKVKPAPTLDLVVLAAEWGSGRPHGLAQQPPPGRARS